MNRKDAKGATAMSLDPDGRKRLRSELVKLELMLGNVEAQEEIVEALFLGAGYKMTLIDVDVQRARRETKRLISEVTPKDAEIRRE